MGKYADMLLDGSHDEQTGEYIGEAVGYPRTKQKGFYNSIGKRKPKRNIKHSLKGQSLGGVHLVGKNVTTEKQGNCIIADFVGKRGKKRYVLIDEKGNEHKVMFRLLIFKKATEENINLKIQTNELSYKQNNKDHPIL